MMTELRRLWYLLDTNDIHTRPRYIRPAANVWADTLSRELDTEDWRLNPRFFKHLQERWGPHTIDRFASMLNAQLPRFNARWRDPQCEDVDCLRLPDAAWRRENNYCNPPWTALPALARQTCPITGRNDCHRPLLAGQTVVPRFRPARHRDVPLPGGLRPFLSRRARQARGGRTTRVEHRGLSALTPSWLYTRRGTIGRAFRPDRLMSLVQPVCPLRTGPPRYRLQIGAAPEPWSADIAETFHDLLGTDKLGVTAVALLSNSLAPSTYASYDSALRQFFLFCTKENIAPLKATRHYGSLHRLVGYARHSRR
jgi:hypothetical protein